MTRALSSFHRSKTAHRLEINVAANCKKQLRDGSMPAMDRDVERSTPILCLKISVTASSNEHLRNGRIPFLGREMEGRVPKLPLLKVDVTVRWEKQLRDGSMS
jgi:hypothetical protein